MREVSHVVTHCVPAKFSPVLLPGLVNGLSKVSRATVRGLSRSIEPFVAD